MAMEETCVDPSKEYKKRVLEINENALYPPGGSQSQSGDG